MASKFSLGGVCVAAALALTATNANAATLLTFGQANSGSPVSATNNAAQTSTTISASNVAIDITQLLGSSAGTISAVLNLNATSSGAATTVAGFVAQMFGGTFSITSGGYNYLSGTFTGATFGGGSSLTLSGSTPGQTVNFTSDYFGNNIMAPRALSFSFANVNPQVSVCGTTTCAFTASVAGTLSGGVPEPATWGMMILGFGAVGFAMRRRREKVSVRFA